MSLRPNYPLRSYSTPVHPTTRPTPPAAPLTSLPLEIVHKILHHLDSLATLRSAALTCRALHHAARCAPASVYACVVAREFPKWALRVMDMWRPRGVREIVRTVLEKGWYIPLDVFPGLKVGVDGRLSEDRKVVGRAEARRLVDDRRRLYAAAVRMYLVDLRNDHGHARHYLPKEYMAKVRTMLNALKNLVRRKKWTTQQVRSLVLDPLEELDDDNATLDKVSKELERYHLGIYISLLLSNTIYLSPMEDADDDIPLMRDLSLLLRLTRAEYYALFKIDVYLIRNKLDEVSQIFYTRQRLLPVLRSSLERLANPNPTATNPFPPPTNATPAAISSFLATLPDRPEQAFPLVSLAIQPVDRHGERSSREILVAEEELPEEARGWGMERVGWGLMLGEAVDEYLEMRVAGLGVEEGGEGGWPELE